MNRKLGWIGRGVSAAVLVVGLMSSPVVAQAASPPDATASTTKGEDPPGIDHVKRDTHHEVGHVIWGKMTKDERALWTEIWTLTLGTESELWQSYTAPSGKTENYYAVSDVEGFCVAFSYMMCGVEVPSVISGFIESVMK